MLLPIFEFVLVDVLAKRVICVKPYRQFVALFWMDGLEEREDGCFYYREEEAGSKSWAAAEAAVGGPASEEWRGCKGGVM